MRNAVLVFVLLRICGVKEKSEKLVFNSYNDILNDSASLCNLYWSSAVCHALKFIYISNLKENI